MRDRLLAVFGGSGAGLVALCCVTPLLPWALAALGVGGLTGYVYRDAVLFPVLAGFLILMGVALWRIKRRRSN